MPEVLHHWWHVGETKASICGWIRDLALVLCVLSVHAVESVGDRTRRPEGRRVCTGEWEDGR
jgi:hypothetical protein